MKLKLIDPLDSLSKAYFQQTVTDAELDTFTGNAKELLDNFNDKESEEHNKNLVRDFLLKTHYRDSNAVNTKEKNDLVIHHDKKSDSEIAVIIETKKRTNKGEMISEAKPNAKALHELIYYYLKERYTHNQNNIKHLVATNGYEWYFFDEVWFEKNIYRNASLKKSFLDFKPSGNDTKHFYDNVAAVFLKNYNGDIPCTYVNFEETFTGKKPGKKELKALYKLFAPEHLLKKPFANDSNVLKREFYYELLYILGLEEKKDGSKKLIDRAVKNRCEGSLLENTISKLQTTGKWKNVDNLNVFGEDEEKQIFSIALELCINWLNRVLFLKLLEGQLIRYSANAGAPKTDAAFLDVTHIKDYDELNELFFEVLAVPLTQRGASVKNKFGNIPYLNSSLFETSELEQATIDISNLKDRLKMPLLGNTILKENTKTLTGELPTLEYLFRFLDAYNFSSDENDETQRNDKPIINAAVLGLIFEKINGYKDGSFFTPSFITMYMSRESLRRAVVQKFNDTKQWNCETLNDVYNAMERGKVKINEANEIVNSLKICDPAVGSGHFLVSALNELIFIKHELQILADENQKLIGGFKLTIERDELILMRGYEFYTYNYTDPESQRVQQALFREKQILIENCLFGVDINPKSVMICRLRLWIELLKNAYYTGGKNTELQTLPNIDINIKCGNSLISRFALNEDLSEVFRKQKFSRKTYLLAVDSYKNATSKGEKEDLRTFIQSIKDNFKATVFNNNPTQKALNLKKGELIALDHVDLWGKKKLTDDQVELAQRRLKKEIAALEQQYEDYKSSAIYRNAFEWRFEFPEVLDDDGNYVGFDVVIGNPPYGVKFSNEDKEFYRQTYSDIHVRTPESFVYFVHRFTKISNNSASCCLIIPSSFLNQVEFEKTRKILLEKYSLFVILNLGDEVFEDVATPTCIIGFDKVKTDTETLYADLAGVERNLLSKEMDSVDFSIPSKTLMENQSFSLLHKPHKTLLDKCYFGMPTLKDVAEEVATGISSGLDKAYVFLPDEIKNKKLESQLLKKLVIGGEIHRYFINPLSQKKIIYINDEVEVESYPHINNELLKYKGELIKRREAANGKMKWYSLNWPRRKKLFEEPKILIRQTANRIMAAYDDDKWYCLKSGIIIQLPKESKYSYSFLVGLLNSEMLNFLYHDLVNEDNRIFPEVKPVQLFKLPIKLAETKMQKEISVYVDKILAAKKTDPAADTSKWENEIDELVFELYGLTEEEKKIVKGT